MADLTASALAAQTAFHEAPIQFVSFFTGGQEFGVDIVTVREIRGWSETTSIPRSPPHLRGVINLRGAIVPIIDLGARFGAGQTVCSARHVTIIVSVGTRLVGLLVDSVHDIVTALPGDIRPLPDINRAGPDGDFLSGLLAVGERMISLLSLEAVLFDDRSDIDAAIDQGQRLLEGE